MAQLGHPGQHPEGRFLPETYVYTRGDSDLDVLKRAHAAMDKALDAAWQSRAADLPLKSTDEALILASIVEKETGIADERPQIAGVFAAPAEARHAPADRPDRDLRHGQRLRRQHPHAATC